MYLPYPKFFFVSVFSLRKEQVEVENMPCKSVQNKVAYNRETAITFFISKGQSTAHLIE